jgi:alpha-beta hydrolase superfamily lysophospholipase
MENSSFVDQYGVKVFTRCWPVDGARGVVLLAHGASEHSGRYDRFAQALNAAGLAAVALDHRGHGLTGSSTGAGVMGPGGGMAVIDDLHELRAIAATRFGSDTPMYLFGHSMGSLIAFGYLCHHSAGLTGGVLCGFPANVDDTASLAELLQGIAEAGMRDAPASDLLRNDQSMFEPVRSPFDWLSRDTHEVDLYLADPFCGDNNPLTYGYLLDLLETIAPAAAKLASITCPVLVIAGDHDPAGAMGAHPTDVAGRLIAAGVDTTLTLYAGARHEILNETNRDEVTADIVGWLQSK